MGLKFTYCCIGLTFCLLSQVAVGQKLNKLVSVTGDAGVYGDFYRMEPDIAGAVKPRRPGTLCRLIVNTTVNIKDFSCPITMALPTGMYGEIMPYAPALNGNGLDNLKQLMRNPLNRVSIAPKYKWVQLTLGSQSPNYSELSVGDLAVWGTGINLTPGKLRFSCFSGSSQLAIEENLQNSVKGIYARKIQSFKIGYGHQDSAHIYFIQSFMKDDTSSLQSKPNQALPQFGYLSSVDFRINLPNSVYIKGEVAASSFTRNVSSDEVPAAAPSYSLFSRNNATTQLDYASVLSVGTDRKNFGIRTVARYYGDGFVPMGFPFMQTDRLEVTVDPRFTLFKNKLLVTGSIGKRVNNVSGTKASTTTQSIGNLIINAQLHERLSLSASFSNYGYRNSVMNDTFRLEMVSLSWSISPTYSYNNKKCLQSISLLYSQNNFRDFNIVSGTLNNNDASNMVLSYMRAQHKKPFSFSTTFSYFDNNTSYGKLQTLSGRVNFGYKFFAKKLSTTIGFMLAHNQIGSNTSGLQQMFMLGAKYAFTKKVFFSINGSINHYNYAESRPGLSYKENFLRTSIIYKF